MRSAGYWALAGGIFLACGAHISAAANAPQQLLISGQVDGSFDGIGMDGISVSINGIAAGMRNTG